MATNFFLRGYNGAKAKFDSDALFWEHFSFRLRRHNRSKCRFPTIVTFVDPPEDIFKQSYDYSVRLRINIIHFCRSGQPLYVDRDFIPCRANSKA